jgi:hypothetical protein
VRAHCRQQLAPIFKNAFHFARPGPPHLDLQDLVTAHALVVHLVIGIISVAAIFVLNESEAAAPVNKTLTAISLPEGYPYSRLLAERGAGMSQRTRRP